jgi:NTP pyrophosphatase (non-canonical NTP hydrolase)
MDTGQWGPVFQRIDQYGHSHGRSRRGGEQSFKDSDKDRDLGDELADVLFVLICIANQTGVDLTEALQKNLKKKTQRDAERHKKNQKLL